MKKWILLALLICGGVAGLFFYRSRVHDRNVAVENKPATSAGEGKSAEHALPQASTPAEKPLAPAAVNSARTSDGGAPANSTGAATLHGSGAGASSAPIDPEKYPGAKAAVEALKSGQHPERLNVAFKPKPFNKAFFDANPKAYLDLVEPGRIWDVAEPGLGVKDLWPKGPQVFEIKPLGALRLTVQAEPNAPVTFTSFDFGVFANQMTSITVRADAQGVATADYAADQGTSGDVDILAASPLSAGQVNFKVTISER